MNFKHLLKGKKKYIYNHTITKKFMVETNQKILIILIKILVILIRMITDAELF